MKTNQPIWKFVANLGDSHPLHHGGFFVYTDTTGVYQPECVLLTPKDGEYDERDPAMTWEVRRFIAERCTFTQGILSGNRFHPLMPEWFADKLDGMANTFGRTVADLVALFTSDDPCERAQGWRMVGEYFGFDNLDSYPQTLTRKQVFDRYRAECFPHACKRTKRAKVAPLSDVALRTAGLL